MASDKTYIEVTPLASGETSRTFSPSIAKAIHLQVNLGTATALAVEGVMYDVQTRTTAIAESEWTEFARITESGIHGLKVIPTTLRFRAIGGSVTKIAGVFYSDAKAVPDILAPSIGDITAAINPVIQPLQSKVKDMSPSSSEYGSLALALASTPESREARIPGTVNLGATVIVSRDADLVGDQATAWWESEEDQGGGIRATTKLTELIRVTGRDFRSSGGWLQKVGSFGARKLRLYGDAASGADRGIHITAGGGPMSPMIFESLTFKGFPVAALHFDMPGGNYPAEPTANPAIAGQPITTGSYLVSINRSVFGGPGPAIKANGANALGGLDFINNSCMGGAVIDVATQAMYGSNRIVNNLFQGLNNPINIGLGLGHIDINGNYFEGNTGNYLMRVAATRYDSTVRIWGNYSLTDGGTISLVTCRAHVDQEQMDVRAANVDFARLRCREFLPDLEAAPFAFNAFAADVFRDKMRPEFTPVRGGSLTGYAIETEAAAATPFGSLGSSSGFGGQYANVAFSTLASDQLVVTGWVWNESSVTQNVGLVVLRGDKGVMVQDTGGYMPLKPGEGRVMQVVIPMPSAWPNFSMAFYGQTNGIRYSRPYVAAMPSGQKVPLYTTRP